MPVYHFTFHTYGSWMPDHARGYVTRERGVEPPDAAAARAYRHRMEGQAVLLDERWAEVVEASIEAASARQALDRYAVAIDPTHVHAVVGWPDDRRALAVRTQLKRSMTLALNRVDRRPKWWAENASAKRVKDREHLAHLLNEYLPGHHRWFWRYDDGGQD